MAIQLFKPTFHVQECLAEIEDCLEKGWTGLGFKTVKFEDKWKEYTGHKYAHFLNSATAGLHLAVQILKTQNNWQDGDEIISTPITFISSNHAIQYERMIPRFADVDKYLCLDPEDVEKKINPKTRAVLFVGYGGCFGQLDKIIEICKKHNLKLILDAAHMGGTRVHGVFPGTLEGVDVAVYSFQAVKNLPTADSGMICFKDVENDALCRKLTWLGINKDTYARSNDKGAYKWKYDVEYLGYKDHGNSIMASIALVQLKYLDEDNAYRRKICSWYDEYFKGCEKVHHIPVCYGDECSRHLYVIAVEDREGLMAALNEADIYPGVHYRDNTEYQMYSYDDGKCPKARKISNHIISLPLHLQLTKEDVEYIANKVIKFLK
ncbi:DegT/DnrJ/EryC1/StrS family aminotransferase [Desulfitobacterium sp.]|uniref:DegT/DnrJ/EryC1/StrS family aminotransferase n=1 Tax=Desulfitobacterium sp. TaxID=49981 RepID=UPI002B21BEA8|nr:DegT/DnrJ/EryC1/StrS family aminotransferase [Desulfitobacterium sp.]MEA4902163.1 DegT/DnrJ/EryC1/StrS family aminotransferase [Desulfitobacterium sp.]